MSHVEHLGDGLLAMAAGVLAAMAGLGGAILLVPALLLTGMTATSAAPLGLVTVAGVSVAAGRRQLTSRVVNHRIGVTIELVASAAAVVGALVSGLLGETFVAWMLAVVALAAAVIGARGRGLRNPPDPACEPSDVGERIGALDGAYPLGDQVVPYRPKRVAPALGFMALAGFIAGSAGVSGGFVKTSAATEIMRVPMKVATATTTFTVGVTASVALIVYAIQGRIEPRSCAAVLVGSLLGGQIGAHIQHHLSPVAIRYLRSGLLVLVAVLLVTR
ncbi:MAG: sulfite exporter TauE/SafE family protein [Ilumatobacteraceae bacterium]